MVYSDIRSYIEKFKNELVRKRPIFRRLWNTNMISMQQLSEMSLQERASLGIVVIPAKAKSTTNMLGINKKEYLYAANFEDLNNESQHLLEVDFPSGTIERTAYADSAELSGLVCEEVGSLKKNKASNVRKLKAFTFTYIYFT